MKKRSALYTMTACALMAALMCVLCPLSIPIGPIPISLSILVLIVTTMVLGTWRALVSYTVYLLLGAVGMPVFSGFSCGVGRLLGTTGGYIVGFLCIALIYWLLTAKLGESLPVKALACVLGLLVCYLFGTVWFIVVYGRTTGPVGIMTALGWCVFPYVVPDLLKLVLAVTLSQRVKGFLR